MWVSKYNKTYLWVFGVCFDTEAQTHWSVSSSEIYGPGLSLSDNVLIQEECLSGHCCFQLTGDVRCWQALQRGKLPGKETYLEQTGCIADYLTNNKSTFKEINTMNAVVDA